MKMLLIDTGYFNYELNEPLGIETIYSFLNNTYGDEIEIDLIYTLVDEGFILRDIYDAVFISGNFNDDGMLHEVINFYSESNFKPLIVVGGVYATLSPETLLDMYENIICIIGEGEISSVQIIEMLLTSKEPVNFAQVNNAAYICDGEVVHTPRKILDLGTIHHLPYRKYLKGIIDNGGLVRLEASRGCDWNACSFCIVKWKYGNKKRRCYPMDRVINDIVFLSNNGAKIVYFTDEEFISFDYDRVTEFCDEIIRLKQSRIVSGDMQFFASTSALCVCALSKKHESLLKKLKDAGFRGFFIGIESGSETQLKRYNKGATAQENIQALRLLNKYGFFVDIGFIMFDPAMSLNELTETLDFIQTSDLYSTTSRLIKELRLLQNTSYFETYAKTVCAEKLNPADLSYEYKFTDVTVRKLFSDISHSELLERAYKLQGEIRSADKIDAAYLEELIKIRKLEVTVLQDKVSDEKKVVNCGEG